MKSFLGALCVLSLLACCLNLVPSPKSIAEADQPAAFNIADFEDHFRPEFRSCTECHAEFAQVTAAVPFGEFAFVRPHTVSESLSPLGTYSAFTPDAYLSYDTSPDSYAAEYSSEKVSAPSLPIRASYRHTDLAFNGTFTAHSRPSPRYSSDL